MPDTAGQDARVPTTLEVKERMSGWVGPGHREVVAGALAGRRLKVRLRVRLDVVIDDLDRFLADEWHSARASGQIECPDLGGGFEVVDGRVQLLVRAGHRQRRLNYVLPARSGPTGAWVTLRGFRSLEHCRGLDAISGLGTTYASILSGQVIQDDWEASAEDVIAAGILRSTAVDLARTVLSVRTPGASRYASRVARARLGAFGLTRLVEVYGAPGHLAHPDLPASGAVLGGLAASARPGHGSAAARWEQVSHGLRRRQVPFTAGDGLGLTLHHLRGAREPAKGPVLLLHGASMRANSFYGAPQRSSVVRELVDAGYDVWLANWRGSIDLPPNEWTIDKVAMFDHPRAVERVLAETGAATLKVVAHCSGSTTFVVSAIAGLVPQVTTAVLSAVSLHPVASRRTALRARLVPPLVGRALPVLSAQWTVRPPTPAAAMFAAWSRAVRRECDLGPCAALNYIVGVGGELLARHDSLDDVTHEWLAGEFGYMPMSLCRQWGRCLHAGHLVPVDDLPGLPESFVAEPPRTDARFVFLAGSDNRLFLPEGQRRSYEWFHRMRPGKHTLHEFPGYGHLDLWLGRNAPRDVWPVVMEELDAGP